MVVTGTMVVRRRLRMLAALFAMWEAYQIKIEADRPQAMVLGGVG